MSRRWELIAFTAFCAAAAAGLALGAVYWQGGQTQLEGLLLATAFAAIGFALVAWANKLLHQGTFAESRHALANSERERIAAEAAFDRDQVLERRTLLWRGLALAAGALGLAALFPLRSLGPKPGAALNHTPWRDGLRVVTEDGTPVRADDVPTDGLLTVFPEGHVDAADGQAVLMRVPVELLEPAPGRETWSPDGLIVYSKVCTHAGCPVGLYQAELHQLLCPCHQSAFDVLHGAEPVFGPAASPLPQLPIRIGSDGVLRATGDFPTPVGPGFWTR
ncbi:MAG: ubiquinol-cytochrome c reductase iron-sulfur subunit [Acidobacteria bacterium]|nr:ubiquinol-cytochrome c reductase iron-sulfur subunit [Acidobacteriota bacterium]